MGPFASILRSIIITLIISSSISAVLINYGFWQIFTITTGVQIVLFAVVNSLREASIRKVEVERIKTLEKQGIQVTCPCYKEISQFIPVVLNEDNSYMCDGCNKRVNVEINAETRMATMPVDLEQSQNNIAAIYDTITKQKKLNE